MKSNRVLTIILGGGRGQRLYPLTKYRAKPAVPLGGKYRLIDIPISLSIHAGLRSIFILTQFQSHSLHRHIYNTYKFDTFSRSFVEVLAAEQTEESLEWYQGTADAVYQHRHRFASPMWDHVLILAGDHLYRMDYRQFVKRHIETGADVTVGTIPVSHEDTSRFGILKTDEAGWITDFREKPSPDKLEGIEWDVRGGKQLYLGSMGIYVFKRKVLLDLIQKRDFDDFGRHVIPHAIFNHKVHSYPFQGYWEDIGTIKAFYDANLKLLDSDSPFSFYSEDAPFYTHARYLPPTEMFKTRVESSMISEGGVIIDSEIEHSVVGIRSKIKEGCTIKSSIMMGADYYEDEEVSAREHQLPIGLGRNVHVERAIIDKNARIGDDVRIENRENVSEYDSENYYIRDGIVIVPKNATIESGTVI